MSTYEIFYQAHAGSWAFLVLFFVLSFFFPKQKILSIILRVFYLIMIISGGYMLFQGQIGAFHLKALLAIILIGMMEMILARKKRGKSTAMFWIILAVLLVVVVLIGFDVIVFG